MDPSLNFLELKIFISSNVWLTRISRLSERKKNRKGWHVAVPAKDKYCIWISAQRTTLKLALLNIPGVFLPPSYEDDCKNKIFVNSVKISKISFRYVSSFTFWIRMKLCHASFLLQDCRHLPRNRKLRSVKISWSNHWANSVKISKISFRYVSSFTFA